LPAAPVGSACRGILQFSRSKFVMPQIPSSACQNVNAGGEATPHVAQKDPANTTATTCNQPDHKYFISFFDGDGNGSVCVGGTLAAAFGLAAHLKCFFHLPAKIITTQIGLPNCYLLKINAAGHRLT